MSNTIKITKCDNQLVIYAVQEGSSYEICNIQSGNTNPVDVEISLEAGSQASKTIEANGVNGPISKQATFELPAGKYSLVYTGLNWGGPYNFEFTFNGVPHKLENGPEKTGAIWNLGNLGITFEIA